MQNTPFLSKSWMCAKENFDECRQILVGLPFDGTCSFRPGTRFAPARIRTASIGIESYSPYFDKDIDDIDFFDAGEIDFPFGNTARTLEMIYTATKEVLSAGKFWFGVGGEHLVTFPAVKAYFEKYPDLYLVHFDAHTDLREDYLGEKLSHASVIKRCTDLIGFENLCQVGIRSGEKTEFELMRVHDTLVKTPEEFEKKLDKIGNRPIFWTVDLDILDPSIFPGTGTPEPGGLGFNELMKYFKIISRKNVVGCDMNELSPMCDVSDNSTVLAAKVLREMLCACERTL